MAYTATCAIKGVFAMPSTASVSMTPTVNMKIMGEDWTVVPDASGVWTDQTDTAAIWTIQTTATATWASQ
jgi:hypothetical protein